VQAAQPAESLLGESRARLGRHDNSRCVSDDHMFHIAPSIDQNADLAANLRRDFAHLAREFRSDDFVRWDPASIKLLETPQLVWLESLRLAFDLWNS
jgi:hypothetical protein